MGQNKLSGYSYKLAAPTQPVIPPVAFAARRGELDAQLDRISAPKFNNREKSKSCQNVLQKLLSEANQDFNGLLQDLHSTLSEQNARTSDQQINGLLIRAVQCAAKHYLLQNSLGGLAFTDELTRLLNRRGFMTIAEPQIKLARRSSRGMMLFFLDVDGMKRINDSYGHAEGDRALRRAAAALELTFRDSDVIARLDGDEFAVLAIDASRNSETAIRNRLSKALKTLAENETRYKLRLSLGAARLEVGGKNSMRKLMDMADQSMYAQKKRWAKGLPHLAKIRGKGQSLFSTKESCGRLTQ